MKEIFSLKRSSFRHCPILVSNDGDVYHLGWSRYIGKQQGDAILNAMKKVKCDA